MLNASRQLIFDRRKHTNRTVEAAVITRVGDGSYDQDGLMPHTSYELALREYKASGSYRPSASGGPWVSVANPNWIIQGDDLYDQTCRR